MSETHPSDIETYPHEIVLEPGLWRIRLTEVDPLSLKTLPKGRTIEGPLQLNRIHIGPGVINLGKSMFIGAGENVPAKVTPPITEIFKHGEVHFITMDRHTFRFECLERIESSINQEEQAVEHKTGWLRRSVAALFKRT